jgi:hypothetical protein
VAILAVLIKMPHMASYRPLSAAFGFTEPTKTALTMRRF